MQDGQAMKTDHAHVARREASFGEQRGDGLGVRAGIVALDGGEIGLGAAELPGAGLGHRFSHARAQRFAIGVQAEGAEARHGFAVGLDERCVDEAVEGLPLLTELIKNPGDAKLPDDVSADDTFAIIYSSGTTGFPKGVMHGQRGFCLTGERHMERGWLQADTRALVVLPMFHVNALFYSVAGTIAAGGCLIIAPQFSASGFWPLAVESRATVTNLMSAALTILIQRDRSEYRADHRIQIVHGGPLTQAIVEAFQRDFGIQRLVEGFGMTEIPGAFSSPLDRPQTWANMGWPGRHPDHSRPWTRARVVDDEGRDLPDGEPGELWVSTPTVMQGYFRDPAQTAASFSGEWFRTGDLVKRNADGSFTFVTRKKDIIRRRGENIAGAELDRIIGQHPAVDEVAAIPVPCPLSGEEVLAAVVVKPGASVTAEEIRDWCRERLAAFKVPRYVAWVDRLPHTPTHKVAKHVLRKDTEQLVAAAVDFGTGR
jgi:crotonobetaine/carnitine-CoA ligase